MRPTGPGALFTTAASLLSLLFGIGCSEAVHTLGTLPLGTGAPSPCKNATTHSESTTDRSGCGAATDVGDSSLEGGDGEVLVDGSTRGRGGGASAMKGAGGTTHPGGGGASASANDACAVKRMPAKRRGLNVLLLVDDSLSVVLQPAWNSLTAAISRFVDDPANAGIGVGIAYYGLTCSAADYANPVVPILPLPGNATVVKSSYPLPINGKAITPAMSGAISYVRTVLASEPDRNTVLVLVTDGVLDPLCGSTAASAANEAAQGAKGTPAVKTFVIALGAGPTLLNPVGIVDLAPLDTIAAEGGTTKAARVEVNASTNAELTLALDSMTKEGAPCDYAIPKGFDEATVELEWQAAAGQRPVTWPRLVGASACGSQGGVYASDPPGFLALCPASCAALRGNPSGSVWAIEPCTPP